ncbi:histidine kinase [Streptomyces sp. TRM49041]|uniref:sensor histidine kinase n=1 Tax=Streptomyces sp. TRM49041 TaxID=2603216 RepID=UPI0011EBA89F|nr:histidine kinase [Streptomyces sp. TRM49041]
MAGLTGWWSRRSSPEKVELYTRWTYHGLAGAEVVGALPTLAARGEIGPLAGWLFLLVLVHTVLVAVVASRALGWQVGRHGRPYRTMVALAVLSAAGCVAVLVLRRFGALVDHQVPMYAAVAMASWGVGGLALCLVRVRHMLGLTAVAVAGIAVFAAGLGLPGVEAAAFTAATAIGTIVFATTSGFSGWLLRAVWELDAAQRLQGRLAVAEERLRFARDLHDVMGRNLSVIALKSELAVQLARRGAADRAVDEMAEVQRIARESQREVREVVRGYREADLHTELEGARGVLAAAGITCRVEAQGVDEALPAPVQSALGWVVREATTNVLRHGDARHCVVSVSVPVSVSAGGGCAVLVIENDGAGSPPGGTPHGSGLTGLRERLAALDGTLEAGPLEGGTRFRVTARVPVGVGGGSSAGAASAADSATGAASASGPGAVGAASAATGSAAEASAASGSAPSAAARPAAADSVASGSGAGVTGTGERSASVSRVADEGAEGAR